MATCSRSFVRICPCGVEKNSSAWKPQKSSGEARSALPPCISVRSREACWTAAQSLDYSLYRAPDGRGIAGVGGGRRRRPRHCRAAARRGRRLRWGADAEGSPPPIWKTCCEHRRWVYGRRYLSQAALEGAQGKLPAPLT